MAKSRIETEIGRTQSLPRRKRCLAFGYILTGVTAVRSSSDPGLEYDSPGFESAILLHHHGVGAFGHRRAGKNPYRLAATGGPVERVAGCCPSGDGQNGFTISD